MPQKRNPVALEHARAIGSKAVGQAQAIVTHRPQHAVRRHRRHRRRPAAAGRVDVPRRHAHGDAGRPRRCRTRDFDVERLAARAGEGGTTLTELADTLVRDHGLPFRTAHAIAALLLKARTEEPDAPLSATLLAGVFERCSARRSTTATRSCSSILSPRTSSRCARRTAARRRRRRARRIAESRAALAADATSWNGRATRWPRLDAARRGARCDARDAAPAVSRRSRGYVLRRHVVLGASPSRALWSRFQRYFTRYMHPIDWAIIAVYLAWIVWDGLRRTQDSRRARRLLPRQPQPAVVGGRPVGDGDAAVGDHDDRHDRAGLRRRHAASCSSTSGCRSRWSSSSVTLVPFFHNAQRLHRLRVSRAALRREDAHRSRRSCSWSRAAWSCGAVISAPAVVLSVMLGLDVTPRAC